MFTCSVQAVAGQDCSTRTGRTPRRICSWSRQSSGTAVHLPASRPSHRPKHPRCPNHHDPYYFDSLCCCCLEAAARPSMSATPAHARCYGHSSTPRARTRCDTSSCLRFGRCAGPMNGHSPECWHPSSNGTQRATEDECRGAIRRCSFKEMATLADIELGIRVGSRTMVHPDTLRHGCLRAADPCGNMQLEVGVACGLS